MAGKPVVLVGPVKIAGGSKVDSKLAKGADKVILDAAIKAFKGFDAVKKTSAKEGYQFEPTLKELSLKDEVITCELESVSHPLGKLEPIAKAKNDGEATGSDARAASGLIEAVVEAHVKMVEKNLKRLK